MSFQKNKRKLSGYEKSHLNRHGLRDVNISSFGEMPVEYISGFVKFAGFKLMVNKDVLIPRIETEELLKLAEKKIMESVVKDGGNEIFHVADIGTGSGALGLGLYSFLHATNLKAKVFLSDISSKALTIADFNYKHQVPRSSQVERSTQRVTLSLIKSDLMSDFPSDIKFDLIMANLPYIPSERIPKLDRSVKNFEPHLALDGGPDGFVLIKKLLSQAKEFLKPNGVVMLEIDHTHNKRFFNEAGFSDIYDIEIIKDSFNKNRFVSLTLK